MKRAPFSLAIHGGAGTPKKDAHYDQVLASLHNTLEQGRAVLEKGGSAFETVMHCVEIMENDPLYNAGCGAMANQNGEYELDAAIMDGKTLDIGSVAAVKNVKNPIKLAAEVLSNTDHVMLTGEGALDFARKQHIVIESDDYFKAAHKQQNRLAEESHGTVGAVAYDLNGHLAAATSTGGWSRKMPGRVGDTPIIGAGTFADDQSCAVSCTGQGEDFIRTTIASRMACAIEYKGVSAAEAARQGIEDLVEKACGYGGFILIDKHGHVACAQSSATLRHGWIEHGGKTKTGLQAPILHRAKPL